MVSMRSICSTVVLVVTTNGLVALSLALPPHSHFSWSCRSFVPSFARNTPTNKQTMMDAQLYSSFCFHFVLYSALHTCIQSFLPGDGHCVICDSFVNPFAFVHVCDDCNYGSFEGRCVVCGGKGVTDAYYCRECVQQEKDRDGCPKIVNLGATKTDLFYERKKYGFKKR